MNVVCTIGDRSTSDVIARLRTPEGRDEWIYCHSHILITKSKYFADRLSENWPTCQILDSRNCVEIQCQEHDFDHHITVLRLLYVPDTCHGVKNTLGVLQVAVTLGCPEIITTCVDFLEASPWEEAEEEEILKVIPNMGLLAEPILGRLQPVNQTTVVKIFLSAILFATSVLPPTMVDLKASAQEQIEYMITEDDDAPLLTADEDIKSKVRLYFNNLLSRFDKAVKSVPETRKFLSFLADMLWACQILTKLELLKDFAEIWIDASENIIKAVDQISQSQQQEECLEAKVKVIEITCKVLEAIAYGSVILPPVKRLHTVRIWLPFARMIKPLIDSITIEENDCSVVKFDSEIWQSLESAFVSITLTLPAGEQADILTEWLTNKHIRFPDLTEVFEVWCYRSKVAKRRLADTTSSNGMVKML